MPFLRRGELGPGSFCQNCATALSEPDQASGEIRKVVTVVFADVTGSTALGERLDPEALRPS